MAAPPHSPVFAEATAGRQPSGVGEGVLDDHGGVGQAESRLVVLRRVRSPRFQVQSMRVYGVKLDGLDGSGPAVALTLWRAGGVNWTGRK